MTLLAVAGALLEAGTCAHTRLVQTRLRPALSAATRAEHSDGDGPAARNREDARRPRFAQQPPRAPPSPPSPPRQAPAPVARSALQRHASGLALAAALATTVLLTDTASAAAAVESANGAKPSRVERAAAAEHPSAGRSVPPRSGLKRLESMRERRILPGGLFEVVVDIGSGRELLEVAAEVADVLPDTMRAQLERFAPQSVRRISDLEIFVSGFVAGGLTEVAKVAVLHPLDTARTRITWARRSFLRRTLRQHRKTHGQTLASGHPHAHYQLSELELRAQQPSADAWRGGARAHAATGEMGATGATGVTGVTGATGVTGVMTAPALAAVQPAVTAPAQAECSSATPMHGGAAHRPAPHGTRDGGGGFAAAPSTHAAPAAPAPAAEPRTPWSEALAGGAGPFAGLLPAVLTALPQGGTFFATYDVVRAHLSDSPALSGAVGDVGAALIAVLFADLLYWAVRSPFEALKLLKQAEAVVDADLRGSVSARELPWWPSDREALDLGVSMFLPSVLTYLPLTLIRVFVYRTWRGAALGTDAAAAGVPLLVDVGVSILFATLAALAMAPLELVRTRTLQTWLDERRAAGGGGGAARVASASSLAQLLDTQPAPAASASAQAAGADGAAGQRSITAIYLATLAESVGSRSVRALYAGALTRAAWIGLCFGLVTPLRVLAYGWLRDELILELFDGQAMGTTHIY